MGILKVTNADQAALILLALGEEAAAEILRHLSADEQKKLVIALSRIGRVELADPAALLAQLPNPSTQAGGVERTRSFLQATLGNASLKRAVDQGILTVMANEWLAPELREALDGLEPATIAEHFGRESPQLVAVILAHLTAPKGARTLSHLPHTVQTAALERLARLGSVLPGTLESLLERVGEAKTLQRPTKSPGGAVKLAAVIAQMDKNLAERALEDLKKRDGTLHDTVKALLFQFADLSRLTAQSWSFIWREVAPPVWRLAMRQAPKTIWQVLQKHLSPRAFAAFEEDVKSAPKARLSEVEAAQKDIAALAARLLDEGKLSLADRDGPYV